MFEQSLLDLAARNGGRPWTLAVSTAAQCGLVGLMIVVPMLFTEAGPRLMQRVTIGPPPGRAPDPAPTPQVRTRGPQRSEFVNRVLLAPTQIPDHIYTPSQPEAALPDDGGAGAPGVPGGIPGDRGVPHGIGDLIARAPEPPPPPKPRPTVVAQPRRVGGDVQAAMAISRPQPRYPPLAKVARIQGLVRLEAFISKTGTIEQLKVVSGHHLLIQAAVDAVQQWRYRPTILNGEPVEVVTTIDVHFTLSQ